MYKLGRLLALLGVFATFTNAHATFKYAEVQDAMGGKVTKWITQKSNERLKGLVNDRPVTFAWDCDRYLLISAPDVGFEVGSVDCKTHGCKNIMLGRAKVDEEEPRYLRWNVFNNTSASLIQESGATTYYGMVQLLKNMRSGEQLFLEVQPLGGVRQVLTFDLDGFEEALQQCFN